MEVIGHFIGAVSLAWFMCVAAIFISAIRGVKGFSFKVDGLGFIFGIIIPFAIAIEYLATLFIRN